MFWADNTWPRSRFHGIYSRWASFLEIKDMLIKNWSGSLLAHFLGCCSICASPAWTQRHEVPGISAESLWQQEPSSLLATCPASSYPGGTGERGGCYLCSPACLAFLPFLSIRSHFSTPWVRAGSRDLLRPTKCGWQWCASLPSRNIEVLVCDSVLSLLCGLHNLGAKFSLGLPPAMWCGEWLRQGPWS